MTAAPTTDLGPFSGPDATARPWAHTEDALRRAQKFTLVTVRADGRPHAVPLLAIWALDGMCFCTGHTEQKVKNLAANPRCILTTGSEGLSGVDYVIEGTAEHVTDPERLDAIATAFEQAYGWHLTRADGTWHGMGEKIRAGGDVPAYFVRPSSIFAYGNGEPFGQTRYRFA